MRYILSPLLLLARIARILPYVLQNALELWRTLANVKIGQSKKGKATIFSWFSSWEQTLINCNQTQNWRLCQVLIHIVLKDARICTNDYGVVLIKLNSIYFRILEVELYKQMTTCSTLVEQEQYLVDFATIFKLSLWTTLTNKKFHRGRDCTRTFVRISKSSPGSLIFVHACIRETCKTIKPAPIGSLDQVHLAPL